MDFNNINEIKEEVRWKPLTAGEAVPAVLTACKFYEDKDGNPTEHLAFYFKGTEPGNTGEFTHIVNDHTFDPTHDWNAQLGDKMESTFKARAIAVRHIYKAFLTEEQGKSIGGANTREFFKSVIEALSGDVIKRPVKLKVLVKAKADGNARNYFPNFPDFITSELTPDRQLKLSTKINERTGLPWEAITLTPTTIATNPSDLGGDSEEVESPIW